MEVTIRQDDLAGPKIAALLQAHLDYAKRHTPTGSGHALDIEAMRHPDLTFWTAWRGDDLVGCIALKEIDQRHGEIKSMHTAAQFRSRGVARRLVEHIIDVASARGYHRLSLETGKGDGFLPAQRLYESMGFVASEPFGAYADDPFSYCMTREI